MAEDDKESSGSGLKTFFTSLPGILAGLAAVLTAIAAIAGLFLTRGGNDSERASGSVSVGSASAKDRPSSVEILSPRSGQRAGKMQVVFRYSNVGPRSDLWVVERSDRYFPWPNCPGEQPTVRRLPSERSGTWRSGRADVGAGELLVVLTSKEGSQLLGEEITGWCTKGAWRGIPILPEDATVKAKVPISE